MRILVIDTVHPRLTELLTRAGHQCIHQSDMDDRDLPAQWRICEGVIVRSRIVDAALLAAAPCLRFIGRMGSGTENIDVDWCRKHGIKVLNSPEGNRDGVGEACVMMLLALMKSLVRANNQVHAGLWLREENRGTDLRGKTVGIIGYGNMGSAFADKLRGFGVKVLAHDKYRSGFERAGVTEASLERVLRESDVISLHLPLTSETHHFADRDFFLRLGRPVWFINSSRGGVVHTTALLDAIDHGRVIAAGLDVLEFERADLSGLDPAIDPATQRRLFGHERVLLTPHIAGVTHEGKLKMAEVLADKIIHAFPNGQG
ncbi:MAG TPA: NAD(P)-dependent oxidoreductase [Flavobacteriales bacterium]|nr:NAD(P)-dependent oxidoreductase [Flavobacteriales bacterium]